jgi:hypothetical protein
MLSLVRKKLSLSLSLFFFFFFFVSNSTFFFSFFFFFFFSSSSFSFSSSDVAFADSHLFDDSFTSVSSSSEGGEEREKEKTNAIRKGQITRAMKTKEIVSNWKVAPMYISSVLLARWTAKAISLPLFPLSFMYSLLPGMLGGGGNKNFFFLSAFDSKKAWKGSRGQGDTEAERIAQAMQVKWQKSATTGSLRRSMEIWGYALNFVVKEKRLTKKFMKKKISEEEFSKRRSLLGSEVTQSLLSLGPTFIKVGQLLSTRIDIVPKEYVDQLKLLQDNVPPFSGEKAIEIVERELGGGVKGSINTLFDTFNTTSLAAASLGQVHLATKNGQTFAVKVQREYLRELFNVDLGNLKN